MLPADINPFVRQVLLGSLKNVDSNDAYINIKSVDCRLFYMLQGGGHMVINNKRHHIFPGTVVLFSPGTEYMWEIEDVRYYTVNFDYTQNHAHIKETFHPIHSNVFTEKHIIEQPVFKRDEGLYEPLVVHNAFVLESIMKQLVTEFRMKSEYTDLLLSSLLKSAIITTVRLHETPDKSSTQTATIVQDVINFINTNYEKEISNDSIASLFNFSSGYLNRIFKMHTGSTIHEFLISCRMSAAMEILRSQNVPVSVAAEKCGFQSLHHFTKTFKKRVKMSPSDYKNLDR